MAEAYRKTSHLWMYLPVCQIINLGRKMEIFQSSNEIPHIIKLESRDKAENRQGFDALVNSLLKLLHIRLF